MDCARTHVHDVVPTVHQSTAATPAPSACIPACSADRQPHSIAQPPSGQLHQQYPQVDGGPAQASSQVIPHLLLGSWKLRLPHWEVLGLLGMRYTSSKDARGKDA